MKIPMENLINLMNLQITGIESVIRTSDGFYLGREPGDIGYNMFIGCPSTPHPGPGRDRTQKVWQSLNKQEREQVRQIAAHPIDGSPILLTDFGVM